MPTATARFTASLKEGQEGSIHRALSQPAADPGALVPLGQPFDVGPWRLTVAEARSGEEAEALIAEANAENLNPENGNASRPDGLTWVAARLTVQSTSDTARAINVSDFAATGSDGVLRRPPTIDMPDPALQGVIEAGASLEGWVPFLVDDPSTATLWFDSPFLGGNWAEAIFALSDAAALPEAPSGGGQDSEAGADPSRAVAIGETVRTGGWDVTIEEVIYDQALIDAADFRLQALGLDGVLPGGSMVGIRMTVTNLTPYPAFFSTTALQIADPNGEVWDHTVTLTPPNPDVSQEYLPGATGSGWAAFELASFASPDLIRVLPFPIGGSPRYVAFEGGVSAEDSAAGTEGETVVATPAPVELAAGHTVVVADDPVNLRAEPSPTAEIVVELPVGTDLTITGEGVEDGGYVWYPVDVVETGDTGFVAEDFIEPAQ